MRMLQELNDGDRMALRRTVGWCTAFIVAGTLILVAAPFQYFAEADRRDATASVLYLVPQALMLSVPLGLTLGVIWGMGRGGVSRHSRATVLLAAAALSVTVFAIAGWLGPASNQAFRVAIFEGHARRDGHVLAGDLPKGVNEMTLAELRRELRSPDPRWPLLRDTRTLALNYHRRWAIAAAPLVLSFFVLVVIGSGHRTVILLALATLTTVFGYYAVTGTARVAGALLPAFAVAWLPNTVFVVASIAGAVARSRARDCRS